MEVERINRVDLDLINKINQLFDDKEWDIEEGDKFLSNSENVLFVAFEEERPVGFLTAHRLQRFDKRRAEVLLYEIGVHKDFRRKGTGRALVEAVKKWAKEIGADEVWVLTEKTNEGAVALYRSAGVKEETPGTVMFVFK